MKQHIISLALIASLAACGSGGNPFDDPAEEETPGTPTDGEEMGDGEGTGINRDGIPPGTVAASPDAALFRSEPEGPDEDSGDGAATGISYNSVDDTFTVDNLAFDGDRPYDRGTAVSSIASSASNPNGEFAVYEGPATAVDPVSGDVVNQFVYRAVYGVSRNRVRAADGSVTTQPTTQFAIVRTGSYVDYGFGGFIYQRDTTLTLPNSLQATFSGKSGGLRDFNGTGGLQYTTADVTVDIDFEDFNDGETIRGDGVKGRIFNRQIFDLDGNDITATVAASLGENVNEIPDAVFEVGPDVLDDNGDLITEIQSQLPGSTDTFEEGTFYAIVSGENPDEIVGVFVLEADIETGTARDTGGFIVYRDPTVQP
ncbi:hypothetical protein KDD17_03485 [Sulfitobacter albidus]|uniref:Transferrin-binding protein-like solute binding protein n=1 Tax=Sulfitobacter albidus TaxID=2829501 RepID=A0A975PMS0_9RHOB|nr:hypothetical protein [Sulfitobacter albidus]QUJ77103.1 hypothetical protein KDD17_03485 [Sulfitobacter albidus]